VPVYGKFGERSPDICAIRNTVDDFGPVLGGINVHAKRSLAERRIDHLDDGFGHRTRVGIWGLETRETLEGRSDPP
jgi:hypothetical protein